jgi:DNA-binding CsgD family transcriptional regulator
VARILLGDDALATRTMEAKESRNGNGERLLPELMQRDKLAEAPAFCRGIARVFAHARLRRNRSNPPADLTPAEFEVLRLLAYGWSAVKIARETKRSVNTVYNHTRAILNKLEASRASEAVARARARGLIS